MSREIKFRGKRLDNGEWVYGCLTRYSKHMSYIIVNLVENEVYEVSTETIGQYTGLKDKNGVEIYEGSIVRFYPYGSERIGLVEFLNGGWKFGGFDLMYFGSERIEVIGNIYENPELVGVEWWVEIKFRGNSGY